MKRGVNIILSIQLCLVAMYPDLPLKSTRLMLSACVYVLYVMCL